MAIRPVPILRLQYRATRWLCYALQNTSKPLTYFRIPNNCVSHSFAARSRQISSTVALLSRRSATLTARNAQDARVVKSPRVGSYTPPGQNLANRHSPTLLYEARPRKGFVIGSYLFSGFCFTYAITSFYAHCLNPPDGLLVWVQISFVGICIFVMGVGIWSLNKVSRT